MNTGYSPSRAQPTPADLAQRVGPRSLPPADRGIPVLVTVEVRQSPRNRAERRRLERSLRREHSAQLGHGLDLDALARLEHAYEPESLFDGCE